MNKNQQEINSLEQDRFIHRYALGMAWWQEMEGMADPIQLEGYPVRLYIQNRAKVPMTRVLAVAKPAEIERGKTIVEYIRVGTVPPCSSILIRLPMLQGPSAGRSGTLWDVETLYFADPTATWKQEYGQPAEKADPLPVRPFWWDEGVDKVMHYRSINGEYNGREDGLPFEKNGVSDCGQG